MLSSPSEFINLENFQSIEQLGEEVDFVIQKVIANKTRESHIAKIFEKDISHYTREKLNDFSNQLNITTKLDHPSILKYIGFSPVDFSQKQRPVIITELSQYKTLNELLDSKCRDIRPDYLDIQLFIIAYGIASAMSYLHSHDIIHCNLSSENIYLDDNNYPKISGFNYSKELTNKSQKTIDRFSKIKGSPEYFSPEILTNKEYSKSSDVYAFSILFKNMLKHDHEYKKTINLLKNTVVIKKNRQNLEFHKSYVPMLYIELIEKCWSKDPSERPTFDEIVQVFKSDPNLIGNSEFQSYVKYIDESQTSYDLTKGFPELFDNIKENFQIENKKKILKETDFVNCEVINENIYNRVYNCIYKKNNERCIAHESYLLLNKFTKNEIIRFSEELSIISQLDHPSILKFIGFIPSNFYLESKPMIINESLSFGNLSFMSKNSKNIPIWDDTQKLINIYGIASAMNYLHSLNILHRDLKPENIYFDDSFLPKLTGFHLAKEIPLDMDKEISSNIVGTPIYLSPEIYLKKEYSKASDIYAFALVVYEIMTNEKPFNKLKNVNQIFDEVVNKKKRPEFNVQIPECYKKLIEKCWSNEPNERPTFEEILNVLKTDSNFITEKVDLEDYKKYIKFIDESNIAFQVNNKITLKDITNESLDSFQTNDQNEYFHFSVLNVFQTELNNITLNVDYLDLANDFEKQNIISKGGFSNVFQILDKKSGIKYSAKIYDRKLKEFDKNYFTSLSNEVNFISQINHPSVAKFIGYSAYDFDNKSYPVIVTELSSNRTLGDIIELIRKDEDVFEWDDTKKLINIYGIASVMKYLHSKNIIHRDLKPKNIILNEYLFPKLVDFGCSMYSSKDINEFDDSKGTPLYFAPEIIKGEDFGKPIDVYSFSLVVYEIMTNTIPFATVTRINYLNRKVLNKERPELPKKIPKCYRRLIKKCWSHDPSDRPTFDEIVNTLRTDSNFITDEVNKDEYLNYIKYIDEAHLHLNDKKQEKKVEIKSFDKIDIYSYLDEIIKPKHINIDSTKAVNLYSFEKQKSIGSGSFGNVYKVKNNKTGEIYAAKISKIYLTQCNDDDVKNLEREVNIISRLNHPSILKFIGFTTIDFKKKPKPTIITELIPNGSLKDILELERKGHGNSNWNDTKKLINIYGIASAMSYLHIKNIIHRDLKPDNILLDSYLYPKLSDFGLSKNLFDQDNRLVSGYKGTYAYSSPEALNNEYSKAGDVYAFGIIVYEIMTNCSPYQGMNSYQLFAQVIKGIRPKFIVDIPICYKNLIEKCWDDLPDNRPTFDEIVDVLKSNPQFITKNVNYTEFLDYINFLEEFKHKINYDVPVFDPIFLSSKVNIINWDDFRRCELIENRKEFLTFKLILERTKQECFAKIYNDKMKGMPQHKKIQIIREVNITSQLNHPLFVKFIGYSPVDITLLKYPCIITEWTSNGSLRNILEKKEIDGWNDTKKLINLYGIAYAMKYLHSEDIIHRHLSLDSIYLDEKYYPKICNFEFSKYIYENLNDEKNVFLNVFDYSAPEIFQLKYSKATDVYAFAMIAYEILTNENYYKGKPKYKILISTLNGLRPEFSSNIPDCYRKLIEECWSQDPSKRPTFDQIVNRLKTEEEFITSTIDKNEFLNYVEFIESCNKPHIKHDLIGYSPDEYLSTYNSNHSKEKDESIESKYDQISVNFELLKEKFDNEQDEFHSEFLDLSKFKLGDIIGKHDYTKTYKVISKETNNIYSGKISTIRMNKYSKEELIKLSREVNIISQLHHPSFLKFIGYSPIDFKKKNHPVIITELAKNGSLKHILDIERKKISIPGWNETLKLINIYGIASGMSYLHLNKIIHRDLTPENIFLDDYLLPKIGDFGLSKREKNIESMSFQSTAGMKGNPTYSSPEILICNEYSKSSDVYSFAFIVYEIITNEIPFQGIVNKNEIFTEVVTNSNRPKIPENVPVCYRNLIESCWAQNSEDRPSFDDVVQILKTDSSFITEKVIKNDFYKYVEFIEESRKSFDSNKRILDLSEFIKEKNKNENIDSNRESDEESEDIQNDDQNDYEAKDINKNISEADENIENEKMLDQDASKTEIVNKNIPQIDKNEEIFNIDQDASKTEDTNKDLSKENQKENDIKSEEIKGDTANDDNQDDIKSEEIKGDTANDDENQDDIKTGANRDIDQDNQNADEADNLNKEITQFNENDDIFSSNQDASEAEIVNKNIPQVDKNEENENSMNHDNIKLEDKNENATNTKIPFKLPLNPVEISQQDEEVIEKFISSNKPTDLMQYLHTNCNNDTVSFILDRLSNESSEFYSQLLQEGLSLNNSVSHHKYATSLLFDSKQSKKLDTFKEARKHLEKSASLGYSRSFFLLGCLLHEFYHDEKLAIKYAREGSDAGDKYSKCLLGHFISQGIGVDCNKSLGVQMMLESGANDLYENFATEIAIGHYLMNKDGDHCLAFEWFEKAFQLHKTKATINNYAICFILGIGTSKNIEKAKEILQIGIDLNDPNSKFIFAILISDSDKEKSDLLIKEAANEGNLHAQIHYAIHASNIDDDSKKYFKLADSNSENSKHSLSFIDESNNNSNDIFIIPKVNLAMKYSTENDSENTYLYMIKLINSGKFDVPIEYAINLYNKKFYKIALNYFILISKFNHPIAKFYIGMMKFYGYGCNVDRNESYSIMKELADNKIDKAIDFIEDNFQI